MSMESRLVAYATALTASAVALVAGLVYGGFTLHTEAGVLALGLLAFLAERQSVRLSPTIQISVGFLPFVFAAVVFGPLAAVCVGVIGLLSEFNRPYIRWAVWTASRTIVAGSSGLAAVAAGASSARTFGHLLVAVGAATATQVVVEGFLTGLTLAVRRTGSLQSVGRDALPILLAAVPLYTPVIAVLAIAYRELSPWTVGFFLVPAFAAQRLFNLYREQRETADRLASVNERLEKANL